MIKACFSVIVPSCVLIAVEGEWMYAAYKPTTKKQAWEGRLYLQKIFKNLLASCCRYHYNDRLTGLSEQQNIR
jgi:hypothetical protein